MILCWCWVRSLAMFDTHPFGKVRSSKTDSSFSVPFPISFLFMRTLLCSLPCVFVSAGRGAPSWQSARDPACSAQTTPTSSARVSGGSVGCIALSGHLGAAQCLPAAPCPAETLPQSAAGLQLLSDTCGRSPNGVRTCSMPLLPAQVLGTCSGRPRR